MNDDELTAYGIKQLLLNKLMEIKKNMASMTPEQLNDFQPKLQKLYELLEKVLVIPNGDDND